jgi:hypothetical protein
MLKAMIGSKIKDNTFIVGGTLFLSTVFLAVLFIADAHALRVSMKRIIFEDRARSDVLSIINNSPEDQTYRIGWRKFIMTENNALVHIKDDDERISSVKWAENMIRYSPRRVKVPAGGTQQVRLMLRKPSGLEAGEYRAHIWITIEDKPAAFDPNPTPVPPGQQSVEIRMKPGLTLPVIVRHGKLNTSASISNGRLQLTDDKLIINYTLERGGERSLYGDIVFTCVGGGVERYIRQIRGVAVYPEITKRNLVARIDYPKSGKDGCDKVKLQYKADSADSFYNGSVMAETVISAN